MKIKTFKNLLTFIIFLKIFSSIAHAENINNIENNKLVEPKNSINTITKDINEIKEDQLQIETYRASGAGGQHVNKTDSAVRMRYEGITVSCQKERSQVQNRETCLKMLKAKLYEKEYLERKTKLEQISGEKKEIGFGSQIRNYIFQPYTLVKDTRTKYEVGNVQAVLDGEIDGFINAYLHEFG